MIIVYINLIKCNKCKMFIPTSIYIRGEFAISDRTIEELDPLQKILKLWDN